MTTSIQVCAIVFQSKSSQFKEHQRLHGLLVSTKWLPLPLILVKLTNRLKKAIPNMCLLHGHDGSSMSSRHIDMHSTLTTSLFGMC